MAAPNRLGNLGPKESRKRLVFGLASLALALVSSLLALLSASRWWVAAAFALFWLAALGVLEARAHT